MKRIIERFAPAIVYLPDLLDHVFRYKHKPRTRVFILRQNGADRQLLLVRNLLTPRVWSLPGGGIKRGEDKFAAAKRELEEELSVRSYTSFDFLFDRTMSKRGVEWSYYYFLATTEENIGKLGFDVSEARWVSFDEIESLALDISLNREDLSDVRHRIDHSAQNR